MDKLIKKYQTLIKLTITILFIFTFSISLPLSQGVHAASYTIQEISQHNSESDCWMVFENKVYDLTLYVSSHDRYMDIRSWCGEDMTEAFTTKDGLGRDHKQSTYSLLDGYYIGDVQESTTTQTDATDTTNPSTEADTITDPSTDIDSNSTETSNNKSSKTNDTNSSSPYNFFVPFVVTALLYLIHWYFSENTNTENKVRSKQFFRLLWNSVLIISLIPSFIFGTIMTIQFTYKTLIPFASSLYWWHVEGSVIMGTVAVLHLITRLTFYFTQLKSVTAKK
ncbi:hypothetical protein JW887_03735 [Candidatus Dojkabacteria bacterium]|nr:hypothetical protein [Candidatus Dojkabacteria bacterium]